MTERMRELLGFLISMAALHDADMAKQFADELEELFAGSILCDAEPVAFLRDDGKLIEMSHLDQYDFVDYKLYKARKP